MIVTYTPSSTYYGGNDSFTYTATNAGGTSAPATVSITVGTPPAPTVADKSVTTAYNTAVVIDLYGWITGDDITSINIGNVATHGTLLATGMTVTYIPDPNFYGGTDNFTYTATNAAGTSAPATVTITVEAPVISITPDGNNILYVNKSVSGGSGSGDSWANAVPELADALKYAQLQNAITPYTSANPLKIFVAKGTYKPFYSPADNNFGNPAGRGNSFLMVNNVQLYGGFAGTEATLAERDLTIVGNATTLSGDVNGDDIITGSGSTLSITNNADNNRHVVVSAGAVETALLDGIAITGGNANNAGNVTVNQKTISNLNGGGMINNSSSPILTNVTLSGNSAIDIGGGMYNVDSSSPSLTHVTLSGNSATRGGGMYNVDSSSPSLTHVTLSGNSAIQGGGMYNYSFSSPSLINVILSGNSATDFGGGIYNHFSSPILTNVILSGNSADDGGGMYNYSSSPSLTIVTLSGNTATDFGGGMYNYYSSPILTNVILNENSAIDGGGMYNNYYSYPILTNVTLSGNSAEFGGGMYNAGSSPSLTNVYFNGNAATLKGGGIINNGTPILTNVTISGNTAPSGGEWFNQSGTPVIRNSIIYGNGIDGGTLSNNENSLVQGHTGGTGNINYSGSVADLFTDPTNGDYSLLSTSPAVNAGSNIAYTNAGGNLQNDLDLAGNPRVYDEANGGIIDMGAYEFQGEPVIPITPDANNILYVDINVAGGDQSGSSWTNAVPELADALKYAKEQDNYTVANPLKIWVAGGIYKPLYRSTNIVDSEDDNYMPITLPATDRDNTFLMVKNVQLYGGFAGTEGTLADRDLHIAENETILSGDIDNNDNLIDPAPTSGNLYTEVSIADNNYHVVVIAGELETALIDGFTITNGNANGGSSNTSSVNSFPIRQDSGGGMCNYNSSPNVTNVTLKANSADYKGGGMYNSSSSPVLTNVTFSENSGLYGGGMENDASSNPSLTDVNLIRNLAILWGGGMINNSSSPILTNVTLSENSAGTTGGGIYNNLSSPTL